VPPLLGTILKVIGPAGAMLIALLAYNAFVDNPQVARQAALAERHQLTMKFVRDVEQAVTAERARQRAVMDDAIQTYEAALAAGEAARRAAADQSDQERADHELELRGQGRSFVVTDDDFDWLRRKPGR